MTRAMQPRMGTIRGSRVPVSTSGCIEKCVRKCVIQLHTSTAARPRQHWVSACDPSPTTRPPREYRLGWVRVVGLGSASVQVLAGAGTESERVQVQRTRLIGETDKKKDNDGRRGGVDGSSGIWWGSGSRGGGWWWAG